MNEPYEKIEAIVVGFDDWKIDRQRAFELLREDIALAKAGALYADEVVLASQGSTLAAGLLLYAAAGRTKEEVCERRRELLESLDSAGRAGAISLTDALGHEDLQVADPATTGAVLGDWVRGNLPKNQFPLIGERSVRATEPAAFSKGLAEHIRGPDGARRIEFAEGLVEKAEDKEAREILERSVAEMKRVRAGGQPKINASPKPRQQPLEATLLTGILGGLPAFPEADWDVIFDVRDRIGPSRANFRGAIAKAAGELDRCETPAEIEEACASLRRQVVGPALAEIDAQLDELGAVDTLLRVGSEAPTVAATMANLALIAGDPTGLGIGALAHSVASAPIIASGIRELAHRRKLNRTAASNPFFLLREVERSSERTHNVDGRKALI